MRSKKGISEATKLKKVYKEIAEEREHYCEGCGTYRNLTHAHLIRRSWSKEFVADKNNIRYLCMSCHKIYDDGPKEQREQLNNYSKWLEYIKSVDETYYYKMIL